MKKTREKNHGIHRNFWM